METKQNTFDFPSPELQEAVSKLWDIVHQARGTINFLLESNKEMKRKLDSKSASSPDADSRIIELEELTSKLKHEIDDYRHLVNENNRVIEKMNFELSSLQDIKSNYFVLLEAYAKLKKKLNDVNDQSLNFQLDEHANGLQKDLDVLREEVSDKNKEISELTAKIIKFNNVIIESKRKIAELSNLQSENENLKDQIETLISSRERLSEEADSIILEYEKEKVRLNNIIKQQQHAIETADNDRVAWENDLEELSNKLEDSENRIFELNNKKIELENELIDLKNELLALQQMENNLQEDSTQIIELRAAVNQKDAIINDISSELQIVKAEKMLLEANMGKINEEIQELRKALFDRENEIRLLDAKLNEHGTNEIENLANDLEVKDKMIKEFVAAEKKNYEKMIELEYHIEEKNKLISNYQQSELDLEARINALKLNLSEKENRIAELISKNRKLNNEISSMNELAQTGADASVRIAEIRQYYDSEIIKAKNECKIHLKELKARTDSLKSMEAENNKLREKLKSIEMKNMKSDEAITLDEIIRENLIFRIEKSLLHLDKLINK